MAKSPSTPPREPQFPEDKHAAKYDNDTPSNWIRGMGPKGAEGKPGFDGGKKGR